MTDTPLQIDYKPEAKAQEQRLHAAVRRLRGRVRNGILIEGLGSLALSFTIFALGSFVLDRTFRLDPVTRGVLLGAWLLYMLYRLQREVFGPLATELDDEELVLAVERSDARLGQRLISALQFCHALGTDGYRDSSPALMAHVIGDVPRLLDGVDVRSALRRQRIHRKAWNFVICVLVLGAFGTVYPQTARIWAQRSLLLAADVDWPRATMLTVIGAEKGFLVVPRGDEFTVAVRAEGVVPDRVRIRYEFAKGGSTTETMKQNTGEDTFSFTFPGLLDPVDFEAYGGDGLTPEIEVRLVDRPQLEEMRLELRYPEYMEREPSVVGERETELLVPEGSTLELVGRSTKPLLEAAFAIDGKAVQAAEVGEDGRSVRGSFVPEESGLFEVFLKDEDLMAQGEGRKLALRVVPDKAPRVDVQRQGIGSMITPMARLPMDLRVRDDFGVISLETLWAVGDRADFGENEDPDRIYATGESEGLEGFEPGVANFEGRVTFDLLPMLKNPEQLDDPANQVRPGVLVFLRHRARDEYPNPGGTGPRASYGDRQTFRVVTPQELLQDLLRRQGQQRREFEQQRDRHERDGADFGDLPPPDTGGELGEDVRRKYRQLARQQRHLARQVLSVAKQYGLILDEMRNNRLTEESVVLRRIAQIVDPLDSLGNVAMPSLANLLGAYTRSADVELRAEAAQQYAEILRMMNRVLEAMTELETFTNLLNQVRDLIQLEDDILGRTKKKLAEDLEEFGTGPADPPEKEPEGKKPEGKKPEGKEPEEKGPEPKETKKN